MSCSVAFPWWIAFRCQAEQYSHQRVSQRAKKVERAEREVAPVEPSESVLRGLFAAAPDAMVVVDSNGSMVFLNDQVERLFGWRSEELIGQPIEWLVPERFAEKHPELRAGYVSIPTSRNMGTGLDLWARRKDGSEFPAEISLSALETDSGVLLAAAIRDSTTTRRAEKRFKAVLASAPDAIIGVNASGEIELVNAQAERLFGWPEEELIGQPIEILVPTRVHDQHVVHRSGYLADPRPRPMGADLLLSGRRRDGSEFPAEISLSPVVDGDADQLVLAAVRDITDRIELEADRHAVAAEADQEQSHLLESLGQLAGGVAHDFNNLLGVILNYGALIGRAVDDPSVHADLGEIRAAAERGAALTRQLLTFARRDTVLTEPLDLNEIVRGVGSMLERTIGERIALHVQLSDSPLIAEADRNQVEQIVINLVLNARDAMSHGGELSVTLDRAPVAGGHILGDVRLRVSDTGTGMPPDVVARAFEPFFTTKDRLRGTGLGLATVYGIAHGNGGDVLIDSVVGSGTTVTVRLPGSSLASTVVPEPKAAPAVGGSERVLLVDDEQPLQVATARLLEDYGYQVVVACDGLEALELLEAGADKFDIIVTDVAMPRMRGDELAAHLAERGMNIPLIFVSGYDSGLVAGLGHNRLDKPVDEDVLLRALREALGG
jgi:PAS domain S-box-containing protein